MLATLLHLALAVQAAGVVPAAAAAPVQADALTWIDPAGGRRLAAPWPAIRAADRSLPAPGWGAPTALGDGVVACSFSDDAFLFGLDSHAFGPAIGLAALSYPYDATINPQGSEVWIPDASADSVHVIDLATGSLVSSIPVGAYAIGVAFNGDGSRALITSRDGQDISIVDTASRTVVGRLPMPFDPGNIALDPLSGNFYVVEWYGPRLFEVAPDGSAILRTVSLGDSHWQLVVSPDGKSVYVTERDSALHLVRVVDRATLSQVRTVTVGVDPWGIDVTADGAKLVVACEDSHTAHVIDTATWAVTDILLDPTADPRDVDIRDSDRTAFVVGGQVTGATPNPIYVIDIDPGTSRPPFDVPGSNTNVIAVQPQMTAAGCVSPLPEVRRVLAVRAVDTVRLSWTPLGGPPDGYNVWRTADRTLIDQARLPPPAGVQGVCSAVVAPTCDDPGAVPGPGGTTWYYQARGLCGGSEGR